MKKVYVGNIYSMGSKLGSVAETVWFWQSAFTAYVRMSDALKKYNDSYGVCDFRRVK